jgi:hypothetical protein
MGTTIAGIAAVVCLVLYIMRRRTRIGAGDDE